MYKESLQTGMKLCEILREKYGNALDRFNNEKKEIEEELKDVSRDEEMSDTIAKEVTYTEILEKPKPQLEKSYKEKEFTFVCFRINLSVACTILNVLSGNSRNCLVQINAKGA